MLPLSRLAAIFSQRRLSTAAEPLFDVLRLSPNGVASGVTQESAETLRLAERDLALFRRTHFCSLPATLAWRPHEERLYLRLEPFKAILCSDSCLVFDARRAVVADTARSAGAAARPETFAHDVLDALLTAAGSHARGRLLRLCAAVDAALEDIGSAMRRGASAELSADAFSRLVPLTRALAALASDVAEVEAALLELAADGVALAALSPPGQACADVVSAALRRARAVRGELRELHLHVDSQREVWELQLDGTRNRLQRVALLSSLGALSLALASLPAAFLGMNVPNGLEQANAALGLVGCGAAAVGGGAFAAGVAWARAAGPAARRGASEQSSAVRALSTVLGSMDDIEDVLRAHGDAGASREELLAALRSACPGRFEGAGNEAEVALLFRIFDSDADGRLTHREWGARGGAHEAGGRG